MVSFVGEGEAVAVGGENGTTEKKNVKWGIKGNQGKRGIQEEGGIKEEGGIREEEGVREEGGIKENRNNGEIRSGERKQGKSNEGERG